MLWELEIKPLGRDGERERVCDEFDLLTHAQRGGDLIATSSHGFLLEGELTDEHRTKLTGEVLVDPIVEKGEVRSCELAGRPLLHCATETRCDGPGGTNGP